jgi:endonuclease G
VIALSDVASHSLLFILSHSPAASIATHLICYTAKVKLGERILMTLKRFWVLGSLLAMLAAAGCSTIEQQVDRVIQTKPEPPDHARVARSLPFGNPSNASADLSNRNNFLLFKRSFVLSYNNERGTLNWAAWRTTMDDLGESLPRPLFEPDPDLPLMFKKITPMDYSGSGYDRGHMVPSADRFGDPSSNAETFQMTNVVPQSTDLNQYVWEKLERYARGIVRRGSDVYTIAGVYGRKVRLKGGVTVPSNCWKIIVVLPPGGTAMTIDERTRVIAADVPNENGIKKIYWQKFRVPVREIEQKTGYNFFSDLPQELQDKLETRADNY